MVLKFTYRKEDGKLECYQNYTIAQNSSQANTIVVTSTDPNAKDYKYCLEFVCYNYNNIPKIKYASPMIYYEADCITFVIPEGLTKYKGHVDMQLIGHSRINQAIVFKSINKGLKAFDVEGSLSVSESEIANTPNIFTELFEELDYYRRTRDEFALSVKNDNDEQAAALRQEVDEMGNTIKDEIEELGDAVVQEAARLRTEMAAMIRQEILDSLEVVPPSNVFYKVNFRINGEIVKSVTVGEGSTLTPPEYALPEGCEVVEGWYDLSKDKLWNFAIDTVQEDVTLTLNFMSTGIGIAANGKLKDFANLTGDVYIPDYYDGKKVTDIDANVTNLGSSVNLHFAHHIKTFVNVLKTGNQVKQLYFPADHWIYNRNNGVYTELKEAGVIVYMFAPRDNTTSLYIQSDCQQLGSYSISNMPNLKKIVIPPSVTGLNSYCITNTGITSLTIPSSVTYFNSGAVRDNTSLTKVYLEGDMSEIVTGVTFVDSTQTPYVRPTLYVRPEHYANYIKKKLNNYYTIEVMGKDYLDENFTAKETAEE